MHHRPHRQQRPLRTGEHSLGQPEAASQQSANQKTGVHAEPKRDTETKEVYDILNAGPRHRFTANGLIVSNCKEGYNDPDIGAVAVFRPVTKKASSLAEQMKGRSSRPIRGLIEGVDSTEERLQLIRESDKPNALIIDLVGITGLADCASTAAIYADGLSDEVIERAEELQVDGVEDVMEALATAEQQIAEEQTQRRLDEEERQRLEAERRAKAAAEVSYTAHDIGHGHDPNGMTEAQFKGLKWRGVQLTGTPPTKRQASRMIGQLEEGMAVESVIRTNGIKDDQWQPAKPSIKQCQLLRGYGLSGQAMTPQQASHTIGAIKGSESADSYGDGLCERLNAAKTDAELTGIARATCAGRNRKLISEDEFQALVVLGKTARARLQGEEF